MSLLRDIARCHDATCIDRHKCLRWQERDTGGATTPHVETMRPPDLAPDAKCPSAIPEPASAPLCDCGERMYRDGDLWQCGAEHCRNYVRISPTPNAKPETPNSGEASPFVRDHRAHL